MQAIDTAAADQLGQGAQLLRQGRLRQAEPLFRAVLARYPDLAQANSTLGALLGALGRLTEAEPYLRRALRADPGSADAHGNLGNLLRDLGRLTEAEACLRQALRLRPQYPEAHNNLGAVLRDRQALDDAEACFRAALAQRPGFPACRANLAHLLLQRGRPAAAEPQFRALLAAGPAAAETLGGLGESLRRQGRHAEAEATLREALRRYPEAAALWVELGHSLLGAGRAAAALPCFKAALRLAPGGAGRLAPGGAGQLAPGEVGQLAPGEAGPLAPGGAEAHLGLGIALAAGGHYAAAEQAARAALALRPALAEAHNALGDILRHQGRFAQSEASLRHALRLAPGLAEAQVNLAFTLLQTGRAAEGWAAYEHRWQAAPWVHRPRAHPGRPWRGEPLAGQSILLHAEQGLGDTLQFVRHVALLPPGARVLLQVQRPLVTLLRRLPGVAAVCAMEDAPPATDWHGALMSLPHRCAGQPLPAPPYLSADPAEVAPWRRWLDEAPGLQVGLAWAGSPGLAADARRSLALCQLDPLAGVEGVRFIALQRGAAAEQASALPLRRPAMHGDDFTETAALVAALDLVIAVDTSVLHLAGGLGRPVWLLNRHDPCWRWQAGRDDSPWYPALRQFRQAAPGDWAGVVRRVREALAALPGRGVRG